MFVEKSNTLCVCVCVCVGSCTSKRKPACGGIKTGVLHFDTLLWKLCMLDRMAFDCLERCLAFAFLFGQQYNSTQNARATHSTFACVNLVIFPKRGQTRANGKIPTPAQGLVIQMVKIPKQRACIFSSILAFVLTLIRSTSVLGVSCFER